MEKDFSLNKTHNSYMRQSTPVYQVDQQVKLLHLQAEVESLLQQLQIMKQQRLAATGYKDN